MLLLEHGVLAAAQVDKISELLMVVELLLEILPLPHLIVMLLLYILVKVVLLAEYMVVVEVVEHLSILMVLYLWPLVPEVEVPHQEQIREKGQAIQLLV
jgi:hypothetical protein